MVVMSRFIIISDLSACIGVFILAFLELIKVISVHRAHRLLSESTLILCTLRKRPMKHVPRTSNCAVVTIVPLQP